MRIWRTRAAAMLVSVMALGVSSPSDAADTETAFAIISEVDVEASTVSMYGETFQVTGSTEMLDERGNPLALDQLVAMEPSTTGGPPRVDTGDKVQFEVAPARKNSALRKRVRPLLKLRRVDVIPD